MYFVVNAFDMQVLSCPQLPVLRRLSVPLWLMLEWRWARSVGLEKLIEVIRGQRRIQLATGDELALRLRIAMHDMSGQRESPLIVAAAKHDSNMLPGVKLARHLDANTGEG